MSLLDQAGACVHSPFDYQIAVRLQIIKDGRDVSGTRYDSEDSNAILDFAIDE